MRYITGKSEAASPNSTARRVVDIGERILWLRLHVSIGAVTLLGYGAGTKSDGISLANNSTHEITPPNGGSVEAANFYATGAGTISWEALAQ